MKHLTGTLTGSKERKMHKVSSARRVVDSPEVGAAERARVGGRGSGELLELRQIG